MRTREVARLLSKIPLFEGMSGDDFRCIARFARRVRYFPGQVIIREGEIDDRLFVVISGEVKAVKDYMGINERALAFVGPGMCFGEMALLDNYERTATVIANLETECLEVRHPDFMELLKSQPGIAVKMLPILASRLRKAQELL
jgi:CRP/FNR family cyclic AMP-dependent transcriptional regulator